MTVWTKYEPVSHTIMELVDKQPIVKVHSRYLPDVLALLNIGAVQILNNSSAQNPILVSKAYGN